MEIACYICDKKGSVDEIVRHLKSHTDLESMEAYRRIRGVKNPKKVKEVPVSLGGTYVDKKVPKE